MPRTKQFDESKALEKAMELFWKRGYNGTSIQSLVDHLGINRASIYDTFGGKEELFHKALDHYRTTNFRQISETLEKATSFKEGIRKLFTLSVEHASADPDRKGCLMVNSTTELAAVNQDILHKMQANEQSFEELLFHLIEKGKSNNELDKSLESKALAAYLFTLYNGLRVVSKVNPSRSHLQKIVDTGLKVF